MTDDTATCAIHGEQLPTDQARAEGWRLEQDGYQATVCQRFVDTLAIDRIERHETFEEPDE